MQPTNQMNGLRWFHAMLGLSVIAAYFSTDWGHNHPLIGYIVAILIVIRVFMWVSGAPQLGLMRFYPHFSELRLDHFMTQPLISKTLLLLIALSLLTVTSTGLMIDKGRALNRLINGPPKRTEVVKPAENRSNDAISEATKANLSKPSELDDDDDKAKLNSRERVNGHEANEKEGDLLEEIHEISGNFLMLIVLAHIAYLLAYKRVLAMFMLFLPSKPKNN